MPGIKMIGDENVGLQHAMCGVVDARSRQDQARIVCTGCGHESNAAIIIRKRGLDKSLEPVDGRLGKRPDEAGSIRRGA
jgi:putative transposase